MAKKVGTEKSTRCFNAFTFTKIGLYVNRHGLTKSSKSPASIAKSNKQWVGTCLYQEECKLLLINCGAVIRCRAT